MSALPRRRTTARLSAIPHQRAHPMRGWRSRALTAAALTVTLCAGLAVTDLAPAQADLAVITTIAVGPVPYAVAFSPDGTKAYVTTNRGPGNSLVSVITVATGTVTATLRVGRDNYALATSPDGTKLYVTNAYDGTVSAIDLASGTGTATIKVGSNPGGVAFSPNSTIAYVTNSRDNTVSVISVASGTVTATISVGHKPAGVAFSPDGTQAYVTNVGSASVSVIDVVTGMVTATIKVGETPLGVAFSPNGTKAYVVNDHSQSVSVIEVATGTVSSTIGVGVTPVAVAFSPNGAQAYVTNASDDSVSVITALTSMIVSASSISVPAGTPVQLTTEGYSSAVQSSSADLGPASPTYTTDSNGVISGRTVIFTQAGSHTITATLGEVSATTTLKVTPAPVTITAINRAITYGSADPVFTFTTTGLLGRDSLLTAPTCTVAGPHRNAGTYPIRCTSADAGSNYTLSYAAGTLTVSQAPVVITANNQAITFGAGDPVFTSTTTGLLSGDSLLTAPTCAVVGAHRNAGTYLIGCTGAAAGGNYAISYTASTLTVAKAPLTVTAPSPTTVYGTSASAVSYVPTLGGLVNGDTASSAGVTPLTCRTTATVTPGGSYAAGSYPVTCSGPASTANYLVSYLNGALTVTKATLTVTGSDATRQFGASDPVFTTSTGGFVNGDTASQAVTGTPVTSTLATSTSHPGSYRINVTLGSLSAANYTFTLVPGAFTITKASTALTPGGLSITSTSVSATLVYGADSTPAAGQVLVFSLNGAALCSGTTDARGTASCALTPVQLAQVLANRSYTVTFATTTDLLASTANGTTTSSTPSAPSAPAQSRQPR